MTTKYALHDRDSEHVWHFPVGAIVRFGSAPGNEIRRPRSFQPHHAELHLSPIPELRNCGTGYVSFDSPDGAPVPVPPGHTTALEWLDKNDAYFHINRAPYTLFRQEEP